MVIALWLLLLLLGFAWSTVYSLQIQLSPPGPRGGACAHIHIPRAPTYLS